MGNGICPKEKAKESYQKNVHYQKAINQVLNRRQQVWGWSSGSWNSLWSSSESLPGFAYLFFYLSRSFCSSDWCGLSLNKRYLPKVRTGTCQWGQIVRWGVGRIFRIWTESMGEFWGQVGLLPILLTGVTGSWAADGLVSKHKTYSVQFRFKTKALLQYQPISL